MAIGGVTYTGMKAYDRIFNPKENEGEKLDREGYLLNQDGFNATNIDQNHFSFETMK